MKVLVWSVSLALAACSKKTETAATEGGGGGGGSKLVASCDQRELPGAPIKNCIEYMGGAWTKKEVQARCGMEGHKFLEGACPTEGVVFTCLQEGGKPMEAVIRYYDKPERAQKMCKDVSGVAK
jgi:hypothetical protein